jgi:hypothetical protein
VLEVLIDEFDDLADLSSGLSHVYQARVFQTPTFDE